MAQIWQAYNDRNQQMVAIKTLLPKYSRDKEQVYYLEWEYTVGQKVIHPRIIHPCAFGYERGAPYLAMEWFPSRNLKRRVLQGLDKLAPMLPQVIGQAAEGLGYFNAKGWVHRDIKPDNFVMADDGQVKLIDFGIARRARRGLARLLALKAKPQGTRSYMAPEQIRGSVPDIRSDVYSFGCTLFELVSGKPPFTGSNSNDLLMKHLKAPPPALEAANRNVTAEFAQLVRRMLAKDPYQRPESVEDFLAEFRTIRLFRTTPRPPAEVSP